MVLPLGVAQALLARWKTEPTPLLLCAQLWLPLTKSKTFPGDCASSARRHIQLPAIVEQNSQFRGLTD